MKLNAKKFIRKYQIGGTLPLPFPEAVSNQPSNADLAIEQLNFLSQQKEQTPYQQVPKETLLDKSIPFISPAINLGVGIANLFQAGKAKRKQRAYERAFQRELAQRQEESRVNDYYYVPQQYQQGGLTKLDLFSEYYNQMEGTNDLMQQQLENYYNEKNQRLIADYQNKKSTGLSNVFQGVMGTLPFLQKGGSIKQDKGNSQALDSLRIKREKRLSNKVPDMKYTPPAGKVLPESSGKSKSKDRFREMQQGGEYDPTKDIYSKDFDFSLPNEVKDEISQVQIDNSIDQTLMDWIFEEPPEYNYEQEVDNEPYTYSPDLKGGSIAVTHKNPGNIKFGRFAQKYGAVAGKPATDGGVFAVFPDVETGLKAQRDLLKSPTYANLRVGDAMKKWSNKGYGDDLYPELADRKMYTLSEQELKDLQRRQIRREDGNMYKQLFGQND